MKRFLLLLMLFCIEALSVFAQQVQREPPTAQVHAQAVVLQPPRIIVRMPHVVSMTWRRIHYGGFEQSVVFLQPPEVRIVPARVIYILPNAIDTLSGHMLFFKGGPVGFYPRSGKRIFLPDIVPSQALPEPRLEGLWQNRLDTLFRPQYRLHTDSDAVQ